VRWIFSQLIFRLLSTLECTCSCTYTIFCQLFSETMRKHGGNIFSGGSKSQLFESFMMRDVRLPVLVSLLERSSMTVFILVFVIHRYLTQLQMFQFFCNMIQGYYCVKYEAPYPQYLCKVRLPLSLFLCIITVPLLLIRKFRVFKCFFLLSYWLLELWITWWYGLLFIANSHVCHCWCCYQYCRLLIIAW
jgi:hypothetical protein